MKNLFRNFLTALLAFVIMQGMAQEKLTLEKIFNEGMLITNGIGPVKWLPDGESYLTTEQRQESSFLDLVKINAKTGNKEVLVSAEMLIPGDTKKPLRLQRYSWSHDNTKLLIFTNTRRVWRYNTRGDYWVLDVASKKLSKLGEGLPESSLMFAKFSPDDSRVAYVCQNNLYVETLADSKRTKLTSDGCESIINGTFDWVYEEEFDCRDGFRWSPDGSSIAFWQSDTKGTGVFYMVNNVDSVYSALIPLPYPKVGTTLSAVKTGVVKLADGKIDWFPLPGNPRENYIPRMDFIPGTNSLMIQQFNRLQNTNTVWKADSYSMKIEKLLEEKDEAWVDVYDNTSWLGKQWFTWTSERDGWRRLYKVSADAKMFIPITAAHADFESIEAIDEKGGWVYYIASPASATERYLYRSRLNGEGSPEKLSPADLIGHHSYNIAPGARYAIHIFDNSTTPPVYSLVSLPKHQTIRVFEDNSEVKKAFTESDIPRKQFIKINIGEVTLDGWMLKPPSFNPAKKYPVIFHVYGEPAGSTVQNSWGFGDLWHEYLAHQGYIVMSFDNRGVNLLRGREWRKCIYGRVGILAPEDQANAVREVVNTYPFIDPDRIGVWGWSGGGSMTLNALFRYPDLYKAGISVAPVADQRLYDAVYQERYMGLPTTNPDGFRDGSPINHVKNLKGKLLLIHGTGDDNVHFQNAEWLVDELVKNNKLFQMMAYPMRSHGIYEREGTTLHLYRTMERFWLENLPNEAK